MNSFSVQNIIDGQGIEITLTGMLIVFLGLLCVSFFIAAIPHVLKLLERGISAKKKRTQSSSTVMTSKGDSEEDLIPALIGLVLHMELELSSASDNQRITLSKTEDQRSKWGNVAKMRPSPGRRTNEKVRNLS
ncbi:OadG family protein [Deltaproteobacteria bacterium TL4]